jgi:hypothetical protein
VKLNISGTILIFIALVFSFFTKSNFTNYRFRLKPGIDLTWQSAVQNKMNWELSALTCSGASEVPCTIEVDEAYTHIEYLSGFSIRVLNTTGANIISINAEFGYNNTQPNPDEQYYRITNGNNYTFVNDRFE